MMPRKGRVRIAGAPSPLTGRRLRAPATPLGVPALAWRLLATALTILAVAAVASLADAVLRALGVVTYAVMLGILLTALLQPLSQGLRRRRVPDSLAAAAALLVGTAALAAVTAVITSGFADSWPVLAGRVQSGLAEVQSWSGVGGVSEIGSHLLDALRANAAGLAGQVATTVNKALHLVAGGLLTVVTTFFLLRDGYRMTDAVILLAPARQRNRIRQSGAAAWTALSATVRGLLAVAVADGVLIGICLSAMHVPAAAALALLAFLTAFIPIAGAVVSGIVIALVALVGNGPAVAAFAVLAVVVVNQVDAHLLQPFIMSRASKLHPLAVILTVAAGATVWGLAGALFAVPVAAVAVATTRTLRGTQGERS